MSFTTGGLLLLESRAVAKLHVPGEPWAATLERARDAGATALPKIASNRRVLNEIVLRLSALAAEELALLADEADHEEAQALLWVAICRTYRFIEEFVREVVIDRYLSYRLDLPSESFDIFFHDRSAATPVHGDFARGRQGAVRATDSVLGKGFEKASQVDVAMVQIALCNLCRSKSAG